ncbi:MAG: hypothetical protein AAGI52_09935 [Bacteroidota bacterium]
MLEAFRQSQALRLARRVAEARRPVDPEPRVRERRVVAVLPRAEDAHDEAQREAWAFLLALDLAPSHIVPLVFGRDVGTPDVFAGAVFHVTDQDVDWRRLPKRGITEGVWTRRPDVAIDLSPSLFAPAAYLVGGSPAAVRIGLDPKRDAAAFYDLVVTGGLEALRRTLAHLDPPVVPIR